METERRRGERAGWGEEGREEQDGARKPVRPEAFPLVAESGFGDSIALPKEEVFASASRLDVASVKQKPLQNRRSISRV